MELIQWNTIKYVELNLSYFSLETRGKSAFYFYRLVNIQKKKFKLETTQRLKTKFFFKLNHSFSINYYTRVLSRYCIEAF